MKIWLAYQFRDVDQQTLKSQLDMLTRALRAKGHEVFTMIDTIQHWNLDTQTLSKADAVAKAYELCKECDVALCLYPTEDKSEGRGWDAGFFAGMGKPTVMAIKSGLSIPYTEALFTENPANKKYKLPSVIRYLDLPDIAELLS